MSKDSLLGIPQPLFVRYAATIMNMQNMRKNMTNLSSECFSRLVKTYRELDAARQQIHEEILQVVGKTRVDKKFQLELAEALEECIGVE